MATRRRQVARRAAITVTAIALLAGGALAFGVASPGGTEASSNPPKPVRVPPRGGKLFGFSPSLMLGGVASATSEVRLLRAVGANAQRFTISWSGLQPDPAFSPLPDEGGRPVGQLLDQGRYLARIDRLYLRLVRAGVRPIITLLGAPAWAARREACTLLDGSCETPTGSAMPPDPAHVDRWRGFATAVANRYPQAAIEPWNEPNLKPFWHDGAGPDPVLMARMQCAAYSGIKSLPGERTVLSAGLGAHASPRPDGSPLFADYLDALYAAGLTGCMDALSAHMYPANDLDLGPGSPFATQFEILRAARERHGDRTPIWVTETGSTSFPDSPLHGAGLSEREQADLNTRLYDTLMAMPDVRAVLFHLVRDPAEDYAGRPLDPGLHYGFLRADWQPKRAWCVFVRRATAHRRAHRIRLREPSVKCVPGRRR